MLDEFDDDPNYRADRDAAILWARGLLTRTDWVIFDTETTGLRGAEIVQVGLLWPDGTPAVDSLVRSLLPVPVAATAIHGITDAMCASAPPLGQLLGTMAEVMHGQEVVVYNKGFDQGVLHGCLRRREWGAFGAGDQAASDTFADLWISRCRWTCAMERYSAFVGDWNSYHGNYRWQKLPGAGHDALGDCRATLAVIKAMAGTRLSTEEAAPVPRAGDER